MSAKGSALITDFQEEGEEKKKSQKTMGDLQMTQHSYVSFSFFSPQSWSNTQEYYLVTQFTKIMLLKTLWHTSRSWMPAIFHSELIIIWPNNSVQYLCRIFNPDLYLNLCNVAIHYYKLAVLCNCPISVATEVISLELLHEKYCIYHI